MGFINQQTSLGGPTLWWSQRNPAPRPWQALCPWPHRSVYCAWGAGRGSFCLASVSVFSMKTIQELVMEELQKLEAGRHFDESKRCFPARFDLFLLIQMRLWSLHFFRSPWIWEVGRWLQAELSLPSPSKAADPADPEIAISLSDPGPLRLWTMWHITPSKLIYI